MQNLISLNLTEQDLTDFDTALATLRRLSAPFISLETQERRELNKLGPKSEVFVDETFAILLSNPQIVPPNLGLEEAIADKRALDQLRPRLLALRQLVERADDTEMALGSDLMSVARDCYNLLEVAGKDAALKAARRELSARYRRRSAPLEAATEA